MAIQQLVRIIFSLFAITYEYGFARTLSSNNRSYFEYIPINEDSIINLLRDIRKTHLKKQNMSFIDIGCGIPVVPTIAKAFGFKSVYGLEYSDLIHYVSRGLCRGSEVNMIKGDLLEYNFNEFDVLYSFNPIRDANLMAKGLSKIQAKMKKGAIFYFVSANVDRYVLIDRLGFTRVQGSLYKYIKQ